MRRKYRKVKKPAPTQRIVRVSDHLAVVAEWQSTWQLKPEVSWVRLPPTAGFFTFLSFHLITSQFIYKLCGGGQSTFRVAKITQKVGWEVVCDAALSRRGQSIRRLQLFVMALCHHCPDDPMACPLKCSRSRAESSRGKAEATLFGCSPLYCCHSRRCFSFFLSMKHLC